MKTQEQKTNVTAAELGSTMNSIRIKNMTEMETLNKNVRQHNKKQLAKLRAKFDSYLIPPVFVQKTRMN